MDKIKSILFGLLLVATLTSYAQTKEVKPSSITNLKFVYKDCVVETSKSNYLIGQTASYFFIYNKILKKTSVYEISKLEDIVVN